MLVLTVFDTRTGVMRKARLVKHDDGGSGSPVANWNVIEGERVVDMLLGVHRDRGLAGLASLAWERIEAAERVTSCRT